MLTKVIGSLGTVGPENIDFNSGSSQGAGDDVLTLKNIELDPGAVNALFDYKDIPIHLKRGFIKRIVLKGLSFEGLLSGNVDSGVEIEGVTIVLEATKPMSTSGQPTAQGPRNYARANRATAEAKKVADTFKDAKALEAFLSLLQKFFIIQIKGVDIRIESQAASNGTVTAIGMQWTNDAFFFGNLPLQKATDYGLANLKKRTQQNGIKGCTVTEFDTKEIFVSLPVIYCNLETQPVSVSGSSDLETEAFVTQVQKQVPACNGVDNKYLILAGEGAIGIVFGFAMGVPTTTCCMNYCDPFLQCLHLFCCCEAPQPVPNLLQTQLVGIEFAFHKLELNLTEKMLPMVRALTNNNAAIVSLFTKLGNTGVMLDDKYTLEYMIYSAFLTTKNTNGSIVALNHGKGPKGRPLLGGPDAWIHVLTPNEGQPVGTFLLEAPNDVPLFPNLVIDLAYRPTDQEFPGHLLGKKTTSKK